MGKKKNQKTLTFFKNSLTKSKIETQNNIRVKNIAIKNTLKFILLIDIAIIIFH